MYNFEKSEQLMAESKRTLAGGVSSSLRASMKPMPIFVDYAKGSRVHDVDGNEYIDYILGYGPLILGHSHPELLQYVGDAIARGQQYGMQHRGEIELSKKIVELVPCAEKAAFSGSGTEAVMLALRLARAYTGRQKVIRFEGHYHGWSDAVFTSFPTPDMAQSGAGSIAGTAGQSENALKDIILLPWNDEAVLQQTLEQHGHEIAAIITEPVMCNSGCILPKEGYLNKMREWTAEKGIVLIFDEVITGFRISPGGAGQYFGIKADLTTMGKAAAGGFPLSIVAGKAEIMDLISNGQISHLGTLNGNVLSMAAGLGTLNLLTRENGAAYKHMEKVSDQLVHGMEEIMRSKNIPHKINHIGPVFHLMFTEEEKVETFEQFNKRDAAKYARFAEEALKHGLLVRPNGLWYVSAAHTDEDVEQTLQKIDKVTDAIQ